MKLRESAQNKKQFMVNIQKDVTEVPAEKDFIVKYGKMINGIYMFNKQEVKIEKQKDIYSMRFYCSNLQQDELEYWYPPPSNSEDIFHVSNEEEEINNEIDFLRKKIFINKFEQEFVNNLDKL
jgi:hypothetical protein